MATGSRLHLVLRTVEDMLRYLFRSAVTWTILGLLAGLAYREVTKAFDFTGRTQLAVVHTHALTLGTLLMLVLLALAAALPGLATDKRLRWGTHLLNAGLILTVGMLAYKGTLQVIGASYADHPAIAGVSGLGHMLLTGALALVLLATGRAVNAAAVDASRTDPAVVSVQTHDLVQPR
jgi:di/tricarboxylate transporter